MLITRGGGLLFYFVFVLFENTRIVFKSGKAGKEGFL